MDTNGTVLRRDEQCILTLRELYEKYGYKKYKMSKFEEYDLYLENKSFLQTTSIATVTNPDGKLLALKPDITLSIVKNVKEASLPEKVYYNENVYISDSGSAEIKERTQVGLEYIGNIDLRAMGEVLLLAAKSLGGISESYVIALSHMGFVSGVLDNSGLGVSDKRRITELLSEKNLHGIREECGKIGLSPEATERICTLAGISGSLGGAIEKAKLLSVNENTNHAISELSALNEIITAFGLADKFILDFSVMNDIKYYNGLVLQGFIDGVPSSVLSGGRYDNLVKRFGKNADAIGFAVYIDLLERYHLTGREFDCDVLLVYNESDRPASVLAAEAAIAAQGKSVIALCGDDNGLKYGEKAFFDKNGELRYEAKN